MVIAKSFGSTNDLGILEMIKKILALAAGAVFSMNASASYTQYTLSGPVSGIVFQNDTDKSVAMYDLYVNAEYVHAHFAASGIYDSISGPITNGFYGAGPTSFGAFDRVTEVYVSLIYLTFYGTDKPDAFSYWASYSQVRDGGYPTYPWVTPLHPLTTSFNGTVSASAVPSIYADNLDEYRKSGMYPDGIPIIVPTAAIPEPVSLGLFAIGALGLAGAARRRK